MPCGSTPSLPRQALIHRRRQLLKGSPLVRLGIRSLQHGRRCLKQLPRRVVLSAQVRDLRLRQFEIRLPVFRPGQLRYGIRIDSLEYAGRIRQSPAPLVIGNYLDVSYLTGFGGYLRAEQSDQNPYYALVGALDELRISNAVRTEFPKVAR